MYSLILFSGTIALVFLITFIFHKNGITFADGGDDYETALTVYSIIFFVSLFIITAVNLTQISKQKEAFVKINMYESQKGIYQEKADVLIAEIKTVLVENYPQYEKEIFDEMTPKDLQLLFVKYPEVKNALVQMNYVERMQELISQVYHMDIQMETVKNDINYRFINPWIFGNLMPKEVKIYLK